MEIKITKVSTVNINRTFFKPITMARMKLVTYYSLRGTHCPLKERVVPLEALNTRITIFYLGMKNEHTQESVFCHVRIPNFMWPYGGAFNSSF